MHRELLRRIPSLGALVRNVSGTSLQSAMAGQFRLPHHFGYTVLSPVWNSGSFFTFSTQAEKDAPHEEKDSTEKPPGKEPKNSAEAVEDLETELPQAEETHEVSNELPAQLKSILEEKDAALLKLSEQLEEERRKALSALAETENMRNRFVRESAQTKKFAVQGFVQSLLGSLDNLDRAVDSVPDEMRQTETSTEIDQTKLMNALQTLQTGVRMTQSEFRNVLQSHGVTRYDPLGEAFNPNEHMARFELDDLQKKPGTVGVVTLCGYKMHDRVIRPAEVGVIRKPQEEAEPPADEKSQAES